MSRTKMQRILHVQAIKRPSTPTVEVRLFSQSEGAASTEPLGKIHVSRQFFRDVLQPVLQAGSAVTGIPVPIEVVGHTRPFVRPTVQSGVPRLGDSPVPTPED